MPGLYTEPKSRSKPTNDPACNQYKITNDKNQAGAVSYAYQWHCPNDQNLIAVLGRALTNTPVPQPPSLDRHVIPDAGACIRCNLQIQGTGVSPDDVTIDAGNTASGDGSPIGSVKDVGIRADRADGFVVDNIKVRHAKEHDIYVIETDGSHLNRFKTPFAGEYGVLTFVADHSLIENCDAWGAGDSALYPGAAADLGEGVPPDQRRYGTEIRNCDMRDSLLGYSGTDGNAVWVHNNEFYDNSMGFSTDVFTAPGHPGFPQDSDLVENNNIHDNNFNAYLPQCAPGQKPGPFGPNQGCSDVIPAEPIPVGTGLWIAGGNANVIRNNRYLRQLAPRHDALPGPRRVRLRRPEQPGRRLRPDGDGAGDLVPKPVLRQQDGTGARRQRKAQRRRLLVGPGRRLGRPHAQHGELLVQQHRPGRHGRERHRPALAERRRPEQPPGRLCGQPLGRRPERAGR